LKTIDAGGQHNFQRCSKFDQLAFPPTKENLLIIRVTIDSGCRANQRPQRKCCERQSVKQAALVARALRSAPITKCVLAAALSILLALDAPVHADDPIAEWLKQNESDGRMWVDGTTYRWTEAKPIATQA
jgi:hypothetical protein